MKNFSWQTAEYVHREKTNDWYWTVGIITAALVIISVIFGNALFGIVLAIGVFTLVMFATRRPNIISVDVTDKGVTIDKILYPFHSLESFHVDEDHHHGPRLVLKSKKLVMPLIVVPIADADLDDLRIFFTGKLKEEAFEERLLHAMLERLGF